MRIELDSLDPKGRYKLLTGTVVPRPIGWISTVDEEGRRNLAPFSYFQIASATPPVLLFSAGARDGAPKDSVRNALATGGFVAHVADLALLEAMNASSAEAPPEIDEFELAGLDALPSERVAAPRVAAAPVAFECELLHHYQVPDGGNTVVFGRVLLAHLRDDLMGEDGRIDLRALNPIARLAGTVYGALGELMDVARPAWPPSE
jgi:flavin reductase (DIM6/NTAB) family NADH-FMN oxidoreductase RutF